MHRTPAFTAGRPLVFRNATVLTMDAAGVIEDGDVLVTGDTHRRGRPRWSPRPTTRSRSTRTGGILMPGMVDTHRHMWQTALRGLGADWTLTQYFVFYYLTWGKIFRPEDIHGRQPALGDRGRRRGRHHDRRLVARPADRRSRRGGRRCAPQSAPGRFVLAYGNLLGAPWEWTNSPEFRDFVERRFGSRDDMLGLQLAFDVTGDPEFPEKRRVRGRPRTRPAP